jgi:putative peptidoglycan lipid II flippase
MTQVVIAYEFGVSIWSDAYFAVENVPELFMEFVGIGFSMAFIPMFAEYRLSKSEGEARKFANAFLFATTGISLLFALGTFVGAPLLVLMMAPGFTGERYDIAIQLVQIMSLSLVLIGLETSTRGILHSHQEFIIPEIGRILYNLSLFGAAWLFGEQFGITVLAWGIVIGSLAHLAIQVYWVARKKLFRLSLVWYHPGTRRVLKQLLPFVVAISSVNILLLIDRMVASGLPAGSIAALTFATRIILLPIGIFVLPLRTAIYPTISNLAAEHKFDAIAENTLSGLRLLLFIVIPACVGLTMLRLPLIEVLFERGAFNSLATIATGEALFFYALGVPAIAAIFFVSGIYFALSNPTTLVKLTLLTWLLNFGLSWLLGGMLGYRGVALATTIATTLMAGLMLVLLKRINLPSLRLSAIVTSLGKISTASAAMAIVLVAFSQLLSYIAHDYQVIHLALLSVLGVATYLAAAYVLKSDEMLLVTAKSRSILQQ